MPTDSAPDAGDIVWPQCDPQAGHEQTGHRPAVVVERTSYNRATGMMLCCPTTTPIRGYPFEVPVAGVIPSVIFAHQVKNFDWRARQAKPKGRVSPAELAEARSKLRALLEL